jgi:hypothetical protein
VAGTSTDIVDSNSRNFRIGHRNENYNKYNGEIAYIAVYNKILSNDEISQNCNAQKSRFQGATCN